MPSSRPRPHQTTPRGPGRPRGSRSGETREALVAIAAEAFSENGFRGTSLNQVAERAGMSTAALLHHFGSKNALLAEVLRRRDIVDVARLEGGWQDRSGFDYVASLIDVARINAQQEGMVRLYATVSGEAIDASHPGHTWLREHLDGAQEALVEGLRRGIDAGTVRPDAPVETIARLVVAVMDGLQIQWLLEPEDVDMPEVLAELVDSLRREWEVRPE